MGICTHLGVPIANAGDYGGWFCPCHGRDVWAASWGRSVKLEIPPYKFTGDANLLVG